MMYKKKAALLIWIFYLVSVVLPAQQANSLVEEVFLIHTLNEQLSIPPDQIRIRIDMASPAYYKLLKEGTIVSAGYLPKGSNSMSVPTGTLFDKTATHFFLLELKTEQGIEKKEIQLNIQLVVLTSPQEMGPEIILSEHRLSLYIDDRLVASRIKEMEIVPVIQKDLDQIEAGGDPFSVPKESDDLMSNSVSILHVLGLAYQIVKSVAEGKNERENALALEYTHSYTIKFRKKNPQGQEEEVIAMIGLSTK